MHMQYGKDVLNGFDYYPRVNASFCFCTSVALSWAWVAIMAMGRGRTEFL